MSIYKTILTPSFRLHWLIMILLLGLDLGSKVWIRTNIPLYEVTKLITNFIDLTHVQNRGVSFSFFANIDDYIRIPLLVGVSLVAVVAMIFYQTYYWNELDFYTRYGLVCVLPGAIGNLIDRAIYGYVTDFFHFRWYETSFFVNNLADCFISLGVVFFIIPLLFSSYDSRISKGN